ncbi:MAG TPA: peptidyl-prolyl cis-trans isomerase [Polyangiaceae bacterium]|nr:peptidyl-prolyl cis-trans isomerase [Polyangiaceae bacterium]
MLEPSPAPELSNVLPDGRKVPELPADAPKSVTFAVVLFAYRGAEGAPPDARDKTSALAKAKELLPEAQKDFDEAVKKGDPGSTAHAGTMPRDVLEPGLEYVLFTLKKGEVYGEPIDTPRGYWLLRRTD